MNSDNPIDNLRGGDKVRLFQNVVKKIMNDKALKMALISIFLTAGIQSFHSEVENLLSSEVLKILSKGEVDDNNIRIICDIVNDYDLNSYSQSLKSLIIQNNLSSDQKISLLKIKLESLIHAEFSGKKRFLIMTIVSLIITFTVSGVGGLSLILEALYRLFEEGKISETLYRQILEALAKRHGKMLYRLYS